jgi:hypothetical protein
VVVDGGAHADPCHLTGGIEREGVIVSGETTARPDRWRVTGKLAELRGLARPALDALLVGRSHRCHKTFRTPVPRRAYLQHDPQPNTNKG